MTVLKLTEAFEQQVRAASFWYKDSGDEALAERFLSALEKAVQRIEENPYCAPRYLAPSSFLALKERHLRRLSLKRHSPFPYTLYYEVQPDRIILRCLYHQARERERLLAAALHPEDRRS